MTVQILIGDCLESVRGLPDQSVNCCVTSPPYFGLRDYGHAGQIGLESTPDEFIAKLVAVFREVKRVLRDDGTLWVNMGDSYAGSWGNYGGQNRGKGTQREITNGSAVPNPAYDGLESFKPATANKIAGVKPKDLIGIPWMLAFALRADGWYLRQDIIWSKPNPMPESVTDRCTKAHEYIFMLSKSARYYYDQGAIAEPAIYSGLVGQDESGFKNAANFNGKHSGGSVERGERLDKQRGHSRRHAGFNDRWDAMNKAEQCGGTRNKRSVWNVATRPFSEAHFATFPPDLIEPAILAGCPAGGTVLDPFGGAGTTGLVCDRLQRNAILCELNPAYAEMARKRIQNESPLFAEVA